MRNDWPQDVYDGEGPTGPIDDDDDDEVSSA